MRYQVTVTFSDGRTESVDFRSIQVATAFARREARKLDVVDATLTPVKESA